MRESPFMRGVSEAAKNRESPGDSRLMRGVSELAQLRDSKPDPDRIHRSEGPSMIEDMLDHPGEAAKAGVIAVASVAALLGFYVLVQAAMDRVVEKYFPVPNSTPAVIQQANPNDFQPDQVSYTNIQL